MQERPAKMTPVSGKASKNRPMQSCFAKTTKGWGRRRKGIVRTATSLLSSFSGDSGRLLRHSLLIILLLCTFHVGVTAAAALYTAVLLVVEALCGGGGD